MHGNLITILEKEKSKTSIQNNKLKILKIKNSSTINMVDSEKIEQNLFRDIPDKKFLLDKSKLQLVLKIKNNCKNLEDVATFYNGIKTGNNKKFLATSKKNSTYKKVLRGRDINRYYLNFNNNYVLFDKEKLWSNTNEKNFLVKEKIIVRQTSDCLVGAFDDKQYFTLDTTHLIIPKKYNAKYILTLINSDLMNFYYSVLVPEIGKTFAEVKIINLKKLPIYPATFENQDIFSEYADKMIQLNKKLVTEVNRFKEVLKINYGIEKLSKKLEKYYELNLDEYLNEVKNKKVKINEPSIQRNLSKEFNNSLDVINPIISEIQDTNSKINDMVYGLYNLSDEERNILEKCSTK